MSGIFESFLSTPEVAEALSDRHYVQAMLHFEAALARAQASVDLIPQAAAQSIVGTCKVDLFDVPKLVRESGRTRCLAEPLIKSLHETVGLFNREAAEFVNFGCSPQDVVDSALSIVSRAALTLVETDLAQSIALLHTLGALHAGDPMLARTQLQPTSVTSFGLKCWQWAAPLERSQQRLKPLADNALSVQVGGSPSILGAMKGKGPLVAALMATELKLKASTCIWPTQRDEWLALACELGLLVGSLGKIARDISRMAQFEVGEISADDANCMVALAAAQRVPQRIATLLASMPQEHEGGLGNWQAGLAEWPALLRSTHGAVRAVAQLLTSLQVDTQRMRANLDAQRATLSAREATERFGNKAAEHAIAAARAQVKGVVLPKKSATAG